MSDETTNDLPVQDEATSIKQRLDQMNISYHPNTGLEKLRAKLKAALEGGDEPEEETEDESTMEVELPKVKKPSLKELKDDQLKLIRVRLTCMNPNKRDWPGELFTVGNRIIPTQRRFVPFEQEWHVPQIMLNQIKERKYQSHYRVKENGVEVNRTRLVREYAVEILPPLTEQELKELAQRQAMASGTAEAIS